MGFLDRMKEIAEAAGGAVSAPVGVAVDLAKAPFTDDEYGGLVDTLFRSTLKHGTKLVNETIGPEGVGGQIIGALPSHTRDTGNLVLDSLETVYREGISEPITTALTASSLADAPGGGGLSGLFRREHWREGYRTAQTRSPGQALAVAVGTKDIRSQSELNRFVGSDAYDVISSAADAVLRLTADPTVIAGKAAAAARLNYLVRPIRSADDIGKAMDSTRVARFIDAIEDKSAAKIRDQFFPNHAHGSVLSTVLAEAPDAVAKRQTLAALMGDRQAFAQLQEAHAPIAAQVDRLTAERLSLVQYADDTLFSQADRLAVVDNELQALYPEQRRMERLDAAVRRDAAVTNVPKAPTWGFGPVKLPAGNTIRTGITRSDFYQSSSLAAPLRATFNMLPQRWVNLHSPTGDVQVARLLRESPLDVEAQDALRTRYMEARNPTERQVALESIETQVVQAFADKAGMKPNELGDVMTRAARGRAQATQAVNSRSYDGQGRSKVRFLDDDGVAHEINLPLFITQEQNFHVLPDVQALRQATSAIGRFRMRHPKTDLPIELLDGFHAIWRPQVLLRAGWPIRVVGDEQLRIFAKIGAAAQLRHLAAYGPGAVVDTAVRAGRKVGEKAGLLEEGERVERLGVGMRGFRHRGYDIEAAYGAPGDAANQFRDMNSASSAWRALTGSVGKEEDDLLAHLRQRSGEFRTKTPDMEGYAEDWARAVNDQFGKDPIGRRLLRGESVEDVADWLRGLRPASLAMGDEVAAEGGKVGRIVGLSDDGTSATVRFRGDDGKSANVEVPLDDLRANATNLDGPALAERFSFRAGEDPTEWVETMAAVIDDYTLGDPALKQAALEHRATIDDLARIAPDAAQRPLVHGEIVAQLTGQSMPRELLKGIIDKSFEVLGTKPTDTLSRNPYFDHVYRAEVKRLLDVHETQHSFRLTANELRGIENKARQYALRESKELLYDLAERNRLAEILRHYMPFYSAFQEVTTRWAGLAIESPAFVARARLVWNSPEKAGIVSDENGNIVNADGTATSPLTGKRTKAGSDRFINMQLAPEYVQNVVEAVPGAKRLANAKFNKLGFNLALQGMPGFGPVVQLPVNQLVKDRPELEDSVKWALPFGTTPELIEIILPATAKRAWTLAQGEDSRQFANTRNQIFDSKRVDYLLGKRADPPTWEEATKEAQAFWRFRTVASFVSPVAPGFSSPYQIYIDAYRQAQTRLRDNPAALADKDGNERTADEWFLDTYGEEFFPLTESLSKSNDGVQPTEEGFLARKKYEDLIEAHPQLGGLIIGNEGAGEYAGAVYDYQLTHSVRPGSGTMQRSTPSFEEHAAGPDVRLGWITYRRFMDLIDAERVSRGLPNLQVSAAEPLANLKRAMIEKLSGTNEAWAKEYGNTDRGAWKRKLDGLREIASSDTFANRPDRLDITGLRDYLRARDLVIGELGNRKAKTLTAASNQDIAMLWESMKAALVERNLAFGDLYYRYLENDPMRLEDD